MKSLVGFCVGQRGVILLLTFVLFVVGIYAFRSVPIDAIPNVGENQVIVLTKWPGRSPKDIEDQITYPLSVNLQSVPGAKSVRGKSMLGFSFVQVTFDDDVDFYWARSRVSEKLLTIGSQLPAAPELAPDATALGQIFYYVLDAPPHFSLTELRSKQDFVVKYGLQSVEGVAEVASIGGYVRQYQIDVNPDKLRLHQLTLNQVVAAVRDSNIDVGAKTLESGGMEYLIRGIGFIGAGKTEAETVEQIQQTVVVTRESIPITIGQLADVQVGPAFRRGALDWNGTEAVGGVVVMRHGENPRQVVQRIKEKIQSLENELDGIKIRGIYDRSQLVDETVQTLTTALAQEIAITVVVIVLFLLHFRTSLVVATTLPIAVLIAFIAMKVFHVDANIMSLAGIAIAIGTMVDMGIIISENIFRGVAEWEKNGRPGGESGHLKAIVDMTSEVAPAVITAVSTTVISFLPVFFLTGRDARMFTPLAWTKTYSLLASLFVAVILVPPLARVFLKSPQKKSWNAPIAALVFGSIVAALGTFVWKIQIQNGFTAMVNSANRQWNRWFGGSASYEYDVPGSIPIAIISLIAGGIVYWMLRERMRPVEQNFIARLINFVYEPVLKFFLKFKKTFLVIPILIVFFGLGSWLGFHRILKPVDDLGKLLGADFNKIQEYVDFKHRLQGLKKDDWIALDEGSWFYMPSLYPAASFSQAMEILQTQDALIHQIPEVKHVLGKIGRVESALDPAPAAMIETYVMLQPRHMWRKGMTEKKIWEEINAVATLPGVTMADELQPIEGRVVMLQSGIKASMAIRIYGDTLPGLSKAANAVAEQLKKHPAVESRGVSPDIVLGKPYIEFTVDRQQAARYGMAVKDVNGIIQTALGGSDITTTIEGRERYPIQVRYPRWYRASIDRLERIPVVTNTGEIVPLSRLAKQKSNWGPSVINSEDARLVAHVSFSPAEGSDPIRTVDSVMASLLRSRQSGKLKFPEGNFEMEPVGSFREQINSFQRLFWLAPLIGVEKPNQVKTFDERLQWLACWTPLGLIPIALLLNILIIYFQFKKLSLTLIVFSGIPVAFGGGMIALGLTQLDVINALGIAEVKLNTAVWVGFIALFGIAIDDGVVIATYLDQSLRDRTLRSVADIRAGVVEAGLKRIRPCLMTTFTTVVALVPVLISTGRGADVARAMAIPVFGGMVIELVTLFVVPVIYCGYLEFKFNGRLLQNEVSSEISP